MAWEWENSERQLTAPVILCRQPELFDLSKVRSADYKTGDKLISWQWQGNTPIFAMPKHAISLIPTSDSAFRDLIAYCATIYRDQRCPADNHIYTSFRQIADSIGINWWKTTSKEIEEMLLLASMLKVVNMPVNTIKNGKTVKEVATFGFVTKYMREVEHNSKSIKPAYATLTIVLEDIFSRVIKDSPIAPVPVEALIAAKQAPNRLIPVAKNIVYRLAARTPHTEAKYAFNNDFKRQVGISPTRRNDRARKTLETAISYIEPIMLANYNYDSETNTYHFKLRGKKMIVEKS